MPHRQEWADYLKKLLGELKDEQVGIHISLSGEYVRKLRKFGVVPALEIVERIAATYDDNLNEARQAAGYEPIPVDLVMTREEAARLIRHCIEAQGGQDLSDEVVNTIIDSGRMIRERRKGKEAVDSQGCV